MLKWKIIEENVEIYIIKMELTNKRINAKKFKRKEEKGTLKLKGE